MNPADVIYELLAAPPQPQPDALISEILRQIDAVLYEDPTSGEFRVALIKPEKR